MKPKKTDGVRLASRDINTVYVHVGGADVVGAAIEVAVWQANPAFRAISSCKWLPRVSLIYLYSLAEPDSCESLAPRDYCL